MRLRHVFLIVSMAMPLSGYAECTRDKAPAIPDGSKATEDDLVTAQQAMKAYMASNETYRKCLDAEAAAAGDKEDQEKVAARTAAYNASVDEETAVATSFNAAVKAWKAAKN